MSRTRRSYMPGMVFHITSRTSGKEHLFDEEMRTRIVAIFATCFRQDDAQLIAYVVMTNHFHLVVRQGATALGRIMQSINCRIALAVQRRLVRTGHIFERRYRERPCADPEYLRNVIVYTHLNPVRAGLCRDPIEYPWSSHHIYAQAPIDHVDALVVTPELTPAVELFTDKRRTNARTHGYERFLKWRQQCDLLAGDIAKPQAPLCADGDAYWALHFGRGIDSTRADGPENPRPDLRDLVQQSLREMSPSLTLEYLRLCFGGAMVVSARRTIIKRALLAGFHGADIARYLNVSGTTVSRVGASLGPGVRQFASKITFNAQNGQTAKMKVWSGEVQGA